MVDALRGGGDGDIRYGRRSGSLGRAGKTEHRGDQTAGEECGKSEFLHFGAYFFLLFVVFEPSGFGLRVTGLGVFPFCRYTFINRQVTTLIPVAAIGRPLAAIDRLTRGRKPYCVSICVAGVVLGHS